MELWQRWRMRNHPELQSYYQVKPRRRATIAVLYFGLAILLVLGMNATHVPTRPAAVDGRRAASREPRGRSPRERPLDRAGVLGRLRGRGQDRPARGLDLRLGARARGLPGLPRRPRGRAALRRGGLGGDHRRRAGRDGGGQPRSKGRRRALGRLQHRASARAGLERLHRHRLHVQALLRAQGLLREARRGLRHLPRRLRHARRAVRGADAHPDGQGARTSPSSSSTPTTGAS